MTGQVRRWSTYQRERFPLLAHAPLIAAFSFSAVSFSAVLRGSMALPGWRPLLVAFVSSLVFFLQLRIADEFKDVEEDTRFRPYRPVPRGLVTLRELGAIAACGGLVQLALALWLAPALCWLLLLTWAYLALMTREFFAREWLKQRPITYMWTHMLIMPLIDLYATACDWRVAGLTHPEPGLIWFLLVSLFNGVAIELGRKIRAPDDEEAGVQTYTALWGAPAATAAWLGVLATTAVLAWRAASLVHAARPVGALLIVLLIAAAWAVWRFRQRATAGGGRAFEAVSAAWTLVMYLGLGAMPLLLGTLQR